MSWQSVCSLELPEKDKSEQSCGWASCLNAFKCSGRANCFDKVTKLDLWNVVLKSKIQKEWEELMWYPLKKNLSVKGVLEQLLNCSKYLVEEQKSEKCWSTASLVGHYQSKVRVQDLPWVKQVGESAKIIKRKLKGLSSHLDLCRNTVTVKYLA